MPFPSFSRAGPKADRDGKIQPPKQLAKKGIPLYILKKSLEGDGGRLKFRPQDARRGGGASKDDGEQEQKQKQKQEQEQEQEGQQKQERAGQGSELEVEIHSYGTMSRGQRKEMLDLVEGNMKAMYAKSQKGWSRAEKRAELSDRSTWLRFLLVLQSVGEGGGGEGGTVTPLLLPDSLPEIKTKTKTKTKTSSSAFRIQKKSATQTTPAKVLAGFIAFTVTCEPEVYDRPCDNVPVTYCYEIQVGPAYRSTGLGRFLMQQLHLAAQQVSVPDVRLTVFRQNLNARQFYDKFGYVTYCDDPGDDYLILRKLV